MWLSAVVIGETIRLEAKEIVWLFVNPAAQNELSPDLDYVSHFGSVTSGRLYE